ncbi:MAG: ABC transporter permease [Bdellovibrionota bacterium]
MNALGALYYREMLRFVRQRSRLIGALATPLLFWVLIGGGFGNSFHNADAGGGNESYFEFFFPGALALSVLFTAIFSTISVIEDRHEGFLQGVLVSPVSRVSIVASKILSGATLGVIQGLLLLLVARMTGFHWGLEAFVESMTILFFMGAALTSLGFVFAWKLDSVQGYHSIMNIVLLPMWILSGAVFPGEGSAGFIRIVTAMNPLSYAMRALRDALDVHETSSAHFAQGLSVMLLLLIACSSLSISMMGSRKNASL